MNEPRSEEASHLLEDLFVQKGRHFKWNINVCQPGGNLAVVVTQVFHQQNIATEEVRLGDAHAPLKRTLKRIVLHRTPALLE